jgi:molecular chaperone DnaK
VCSRGEREIAAHNRLLGQFDLVGIPGAPRGVPQIEVSFDIDANGIVHVNAKDLATGKEQSIKITASSGLDESEIKKMVKDAEEHAAEDAAKREEATVRNQADTLVYHTEKLLNEHGDKADPADRASLETAVADLKKAIENNDKDAMKSGIEKVNQVSMQLGEKMHRAAGGGQQQAGPGGPGMGDSGDGGPGAGFAGAGGGTGPQEAEVVEGEIVDEK